MLRQCQPGAAKQKRGVCKDKLQYWRGFQGILGLETAPVLEFHIQEIGLGGDRLLPAFGNGTQQLLRVLLLRI